VEAEVTRDGHVFHLLRICVEEQAQA